MPVHRKEVQKLIASARTEEAIKRLLRHSEGTHWHDEILHLSARYEGHQKAKRQGISSASELDLALNRIHVALLQLAERMEAADEDLPTVNMIPAKKWVHRPWWQYIVALGVIVSILGGLTELLGFYEGRIAGSVKDSANTVTVLVHGKSGKDDPVLPGRGVVYLIYGDAKVPETINDKGEATFQQIPESHFAEGATVELQFDDPEGEPYRAAHPDSLYTLKKGQYIALEAVLEGMDQVEGTVKDFETGEPLDSVLVRLRGHSYYTNAFGEFTIDIPQERQKQFIDLSFYKQGYERKELSKIPTTTNQAQIVSLKPIQ